MLLSLGPEKRLVTKAPHSRMEARDALLQASCRCLSAAALDCHSLTVEGPKQATSCSTIRIAFLPFFPLRHYATSLWLAEHHFCHDAVSSSGWKGDKSEPSRVVSIPRGQCRNIGASDAYAFVGEENQAALRGAAQHVSTSLVTAPPTVVSSSYGPTSFCRLLLPASGNA